MERLTERKRNFNGTDMSKKSMIDREGYPTVSDYASKVLTKLADYEDAEEQGLLLRLPCGIGSDVYIIPSKINYKLNILSLHPENNRVYHQKVALITFTENGWYMKCDKDLEYAIERILSEKMYKETWFLSQEEAEAKLKEMEGAE